MHRLGGVYLCMVQVIILHRLYFGHTKSGRVLGCFEVFWSYPEPNVHLVVTVYHTKEIWSCTGYFVCLGCIYVCFRVFQAVSGWFGPGLVSFERDCQVVTLLQVVWTQIWCLGRIWVFLGCFGGVFGGLYTRLVGLLGRNAVYVILVLADGLCVFWTLVWNNTTK